MTDNLEALALRAAELLEAAQTIGWHERDFAEARQIASEIRAALGK